MHKKITLFTKIAAMCSFAHYLFLVLLFTRSHDTPHALSFSLHKNIDYSSPILFLPLEKPAANQKQEITLASPTEEKITSAATLSVAPKPPAIKKAKPTQPIQAPLKKEIIKETKPVVAQKEKIIEKRTATPQKLPENAIIAQNQKEFDDLKKSQLLQQELLKQWKPPAGIPVEAECTITYTIAHSGALKNITIDKSSGIFIYDLSAKNAIITMNKPQWTHGKTLTITFKQ